MTRQILSRSLLLFVPVSLAMGWAHASPTWVFVAACLAIVPLAGVMGEATEHLTYHTGPAVGGLLNASFGNAAELIIAFVALKAGEHEIVKASLTGSIVGNLLIVLGLAMLVGGWKRSELTFSKIAAESSSSMMVLAVVALVIPAIYAFVTQHRHPDEVESISFDIAGFCSARTRPACSSRSRATSTSSWRPASPMRPTPRPLPPLVDREEPGRAVCRGRARGLGERAPRSRSGRSRRGPRLAQGVMGVIVVAIVGNAAEHSTAVLVAMKGKMDLALGIAMGSSMQIALFVAPVLVIVGHWIGQPLGLEFTVLEVWP